MDSKTSNNQRIAKNTIFLYFRMLFTMGVSLFTSRVILNTLGVEDYGIYNVVGGIVAMFVFINAAMSSATQRYITFGLGKNDSDRLKTIFSTSLQIHALISLFIIILAETIGLWFLFNKLVIPDARMDAAVWVFQCSIIAAVVSVMSVPYNADIIAHEKMSAFAYISIIEVLLKLVIVYLLVISPIDKLKAYSVLILLVQILIRFIYSNYCNRHFSESKYKHVIDKPLFKEMVGFAGWSFFGNLAGVLYTQGLNMMLNIFFGPIINAARGIALQVQAAVQGFVTNFQTALNPQITKNYAVGDLAQMHSLMFRSARFSFFLLFFLTLPVMLETDYILQIWLKIVPENTVIFTQLMLCTSLIYTIANPCIIANQATGKVKKYQAVVGGILLTILPISYLALALGAPAYSVFIVHFCIESVAQLSRMYMLRNLINLPLFEYFKHIYIPVIMVVITSIVVPLSLRFLLEEGFLRFIIIGLTSVILVSISIYVLGVTKGERAFINKKISKILQ